MKLSPKFEEALVYATRLHGGQLRKKTNIPYIGHLLGVCAIAMEYGANETEAMPLFCTILWRIKFDPINELFLVAQPFSEG